jgi:hypothetical protein
LETALKFPPSERFEQERRRFALEFTCEQCAHFDPPSSGCAHSYPNGEHLGAGRRDRDADLVFCKEFELR